MTYSQDLTSYSDYKGTASTPTDVDANLLLYKIALLVEGINVDNTGQATALLQQDLITIVDAIKNVVTLDTCGHSQSLIDILAKLEAIRLKLELLDADLATDGVDGILVLLGSILASQTDVTEATQLQHTTYLSQLQDAVNTVDTSVQGLDSTVTTLASNVNTVASESTNLSTINTYLLASKNTQEQIYTLLSDGLNLEDMAENVRRILTSLENLEYTLTNQGITVSDIYEYLSTQESDIVSHLTAIKTSLDNLSLSGGGGGGTVGSTALETNVFDIKKILYEDIRCALNAIASALRGTACEGSPVGSGISGGTQVSTPKIINLELTNADTEYTITLPTTAKRFTLKNRGSAADPVSNIRYAYITGLVATSTSTVDDGFYVLDDQSEDSEYSLSLSSSLNIYLASSTPATVVSLKYWV